MIRIHFHASKALVAKLKALSKQTGASVAEILRRAVTEYFEKKTHEVLLVAKQEPNRRNRDGQFPLYQEISQQRSREND